MFLDRGTGETQLPTPEDLTDDLEVSEEGKDEAEKDLDSGESRSLSMSEAEKSELANEISAKIQKAEIMQQTIDKMGDNAPFQTKERVFALKIEVSKLEQKLAEDELNAVAEKVPERFSQNADLSGMVLEKNNGEVFSGSGWKVKTFDSTKDKYSLVNEGGDTTAVNRFVLEASAKTDSISVQAGDEIDGYGKVESINNNGEVMFASGQTVEKTAVQGEIKKSLTKARDTYLSNEKRKNNLSQVRDKLLADKNGAINKALENAKRLAA